MERNKIAVLMRQLFRHVCETGSLNTNCRRSPPLTDLFSGSLTKPLGNVVFETGARTACKAPTDGTYSLLIYCDCLQCSHRKNVHGRTCNAKCNNETKSLEPSQNDENINYRLYEILVEVFVGLLGCDAVWTCS